MPGGKNVNFDKKKCLTKDTHIEAANIIRKNGKAEPNDPALLTLTFPISK